LAIPPSETSAWRAVVRVLRSTAAGTLNSITSVIFPADCRICGLPLSGFSLLPVCDSCWNDLPTQSGTLCARCGESLETLIPDPLCRMCQSAPPPFEKAVAHGVYSGTLRALIHLMKYDGMEPIAKRLGALLAEQVLAVPGLPPDLLVVPVPLFAAKLRQRGFNQAETLARSAVAVLRRHRPEMRVKLVTGALSRQRATESQAGLSPHQRRMNVRGAFFVAKPAHVAECNVLLIDDIYTTGATARACSQALRRAGAAHVWVLTLARAQREPAVPAPEDLQDPAAVNAPEIPMHQDVAFWEEQNAAP
jgi:ComF family protein